uniref:Protein LTV1 homolog n=1 Tax=Daphnia atkinsoni TaxID=342845 RepID=A0A4Y7LW07_9CRUS|nr:EOG090X08PQ [Daphnia atkinsoni]
MSQTTLDSLDFAPMSEDGDRAGGDRVAVLEFELRKARETITALRENLTQQVELENASTRSETESSSSQNINAVTHQSTPEPMKAYEQRAINFLVHEYLLTHGYRLTSITFADENTDQDFEHWDDVGLNVERPADLLTMYRHRFRPAGQVHLVQTEEIDTQTDDAANESSDITMQLGGSAEESVNNSYDVSSVLSSTKAEVKTSVSAYDIRDSTITKPLSFNTSHANVQKPPTSAAFSGSFMGNNCLSSEYVEMRHMNCFFHWSGLKSHWSKNNFFNCIVHCHDLNCLCSKKNFFNCFISRNGFLSSCLFNANSLNSPKAKKFIDKKNAVTFNLVHRSQKDPLAADEKAPQRVLVPIASKTEKNAEPSTPSKAVEPGKQKEELAKLGIYFDDDYNYLQHMRDVKQTAEWELAEDNKNSRVWKAPLVKGLSDQQYKLTLPSSVFQSEVEESVGLLNRAAPHSGPRPDLDPDIVAAMDDDFNFDDPDNELEDDFIAFANGVPSDEDTEDDEEGSDVDGEEEEDEDDDVLCDMRSDSGQLSHDNDDNKSRFTEYSMTSSVIRRNAQLSLLDDRFEQMMAQYDDEEMGALDCEEIEGHITLQDKEVLKLAEAYEYEKTEGIRLGREIGKVARDEVEGAVERYLDKYESDDDRDSSSSEGEQERKWDCESILSTYSNIYNHPKLISEPQNSKLIKVCPKTGVPLNVLGKPGLTKKFLDQLNEETGVSKKYCAETQSIISTLSTISIRPKDETPEQRTERKRLVKEYRQERRKEKKANALAFKEEKKLQEKQNINNRKNVSGIKLL